MAQGPSGPGRYAAVPTLAVCPRQVATVLPVAVWKMRTGKLPSAALPPEMAAWEPSGEIAHDHRFAKPVSKARTGVPTSKSQSWADPLLHAVKACLPFGVK